MVVYNWLYRLQVEEQDEKDSDIELYQSSDESSDEDRSWVKEVKRQHRIIRNQQKEGDDEESDSKSKENIYELSKAPQLASNIRSITRVSKASLGDRLAKEGFSAVVSGTGGNREMKFTMRGKKSESDKHKKMKKHYQERKQIVRRTGFLTKKKLPKML